jgi:predicted DNA-binding transcriptional regulator AlpA
MRAKAKKKQVGDYTIIQLNVLPTGIEALLGYTEVAQALGIARRTLCSMIARGEYPAPEIDLGNKSKWTLSTHNAWVAHRKQQGRTNGRGVSPKG